MFTESRLPREPRQTTASTAHNQPANEATRVSDALMAERQRSPPTSDMDTADSPPRTKATTPSTTPMPSGSQPTTGHTQRSPPPTHRAAKWTSPHLHLDRGQGSLEDAIDLLSTPGADSHAVGCLTLAKLLRHNSLPGFARTSAVRQGAIELLIDALSSHPDDQNVQNHGAPPPLRLRRTHPLHTPTGSARPRPCARENRMLCALLARRRHRRVGRAAAPDGSRAWGGAAARGGAAGPPRPRRCTKVRLRSALAPGSRLGSQGRAAQGGGAFARRGAACRRGVAHAPEPHRRAEARLLRHLPHRRWIDGRGR